MSFDEHKWFIEKTSPHTAHMFSISSFVTSLKTKYQQVEIADSDFFGRMLILDGKIQSSQYDEYIYHEALVHPAMLLNPSPRRVLVTGGGEGATLREIFKHPGVEKVVMVDLDREVVELCREHLGSWHRGSFEDGRLELVYMDARQYLEQSEEQFDIIISDVPEPVERGPALKLFTRQYFDLIKERLASGGVLALQAGDFSLPFIGAHSAIHNTLRQNMALVKSYRAFVPSFNTEWGYILASPGPLEIPGAAEYDRSIEARKLDLKFFDGQSSAGMFALPLDSRKIIAEETEIIDDGNLLTIY